MRQIAMAALTALSVTQLAAPARADDAAEIPAVKAAMTTLDTAYEKEDEATIRSLVTSDHLAIAPIYGGSATVSEQVALFPDIHYSAYRATAPRIDLLDPQTALANYQISLEGTFRGNPLASPVFVTEIWVKRDGKWLQQLYQETPIGDR
jgi:ketosteroid isomerase-like protein